MSLRLVDTEQQRQAQELQLRMAQLRRRIDRQLTRTLREARSLLSWRTYVRRHPGSALAGAVGLGLAVSAGFRGRRLIRWLGSRLLRQATATVVAKLRDDLKQIWQDSTPQPHHPQARGGDDGRS